uniref:Uncharacterized protein n=1 Tax=Arundo donax TaxID=35708 RepID=A0A0A9HSP3_ARUDO
MLVTNISGFICIFPLLQCWSQILLVSFVYNSDQDPLFHEYQACSLLLLGLQLHSPVAQLHGGDFLNAQEPPPLFSFQPIPYS